MRPLATIFALTKVLVFLDADDESKFDELYNTITVARGKQFAMTLSDGTKVWLNSDSKLKYPVSFHPSDTRVVELIYGEAYFDVSPAMENQGSAFEVQQEHQKVTVLGTEFNIKAYANETLAHNSSGRKGCGHLSG